MGFPYFNPPYLQQINKIEEGNFFVPSEGIEPDSVYDIQTDKARAVRLIKWITLILAASAVVLATTLLPQFRLY